MKTKKLLLIICLVAIALATLCACGKNPTDDTGLKRSGINIVTFLDCGKYLNGEFSADQDAALTNYGETSIEDKDKNIYYLGAMGNYNVLKYYSKEKNMLPVTDGSINNVRAPQLSNRNFKEWRVATKVVFKTSDDGEFMRSYDGQLIYDYVVPQNGDKAWDFTTMNVGTYENHPDAMVQAVKAVKTKTADGKVVAPVVDSTVEFRDNIGYDANGNQVATIDTSINSDEKFGYSAQAGYNLYLYAVWEPQAYFVVDTVNKDGNVINLAKFETRSNGTLKERDCKSTLTDAYSGHTYYKLYSDKEMTTEWDENKKFSEFETTPERPYVRVYAKYIEGTWTIVKTPLDLIGALRGDRAVYLDNDVTFDGTTASTTWPYVKRYSKLFEGNNHKVIFQKEITINYALTKNSTITDDDGRLLAISGPRYIGLFGALSGTIQNVTFENVVINVEKPISTAFEKGVWVGLFAGRLETKATISNVNLSGKLVYVDNWETSQEATDAANENKFFNEGEWYGENLSDTTDITDFDIKYTPIS